MDEKADNIPDLHALLFPESVKVAVSRAELLCIVPTGALYLLPFGAVPTDPKAEKPHYVIEDHTIGYLSSASLLKTLRESQARKKERAKYPLQAFADPFYGTDKSGCVKVRGGIRCRTQARCCSGSGRRRTLRTSGNRG